MSNVAVVCADGMIDHIEQCTAAECQYDMILPGLINAHCHLEYTGLKSALPRGPIPFGEWLAHIVAAKQSLYPVAATLEGMSQLLAGGCTCVFDSNSVTPSELARSYGATAPLRIFHFHEVLGLTEEVAQTSFAGFQEKQSWSCERMKLDPLYLGCGVNPHAPYSCGGRLRELLRNELAQSHLICGWHLNETLDEIELFENGSGSVNELFRSRGVPMPFDQAPGTGPMEWLAAESLLNRCDIAFHLNHPELEQLRHIPAAVHCPGTHKFFKRAPFPFREIAEAGVKVCLGTDSLASSGSLSMLEMLRLAADEFPWLSDSDLLDLATRNPAGTAPVGHGPPVGIIRSGAAADLACISTRYPSNLRSMLEGMNAGVVATIVAGYPAFVLDSNSSPE